MATYAMDDNIHRLVWIIGLLAAFLTSLYTFRLLYLVFAGESRSKGHPHKLPKLMRWTLPPLAVLGLGGGLLNLPEAYGGHEGLKHLLNIATEIHPTIPHATEYALAVVAAGLFFLGGLAAWGRYQQYPGDQPDRYKRFLLAGWRADDAVEWSLLKPFRVIARFCGIGVDEIVIEGTLHGLAGSTQRQGESMRRITTGRITTYLYGFAWGLLLLLVWFLLTLVRH